MQAAEPVRHLSLPRHISRSQLPDFLIISPPKTGSTWLAAALSCHPEIFVPDSKEMHFFNHYLCNQGWEWYADQFRSGWGLTKGEATPGYCALPTGTIQLIRRVIPNLKVIYMMREPVGRAWSLAKHCYRHRQTTFQGYDVPMAEVPDEKWRENFVDVSSLRSAHCQAHLQWWLSIFPREQMHVDFFESIRREPRALLTRVFEFLGVKQDPGLDMQGLSQKHNEGLSRPLPRHLQAYLRNLFAAPARALAEFLQREFEQSLPPEWSGVLRVGRNLPPAGRNVFENIFDTHPPGPAAPGAWSAYERFLKDRYRLARTPRTRALDFYGFNISIFKNVFIGVSHELGGVHLDMLTEDEFAKLEKRGLLFRSPLLEGVKADIAGAQFARLRRSPRALFAAWTRGCRKLLGRIARR